MSIASISESIEYPESDGEPMGETDLHRDWMFRILEVLRHRYRGQQVYIASDLLVYYEEGSPSKFVVPDDFIVLDCYPGRRRIFKTWEEKRVPDVVFEVTSHSSRRVDTVKKPVIYEQMGVKEYFIYDPTCDYLDAGLQGFRLVDGWLTQIAPMDGVLRCETLGLGLRLVGKELELFDLQTGELAVDEAEWERTAKEAERAAKERVEAEKLELLLEIEQLKKRLGDG
ncbi:MAG: Uma2 family endonuclease [Pirellula sp.]